MTLAVGTRVTPKVELVRPLGAGGMGSVWVAFHHGLDTEVAVKFVSADFDNPSAASRFKREAALSAKIKSPHVVTTFDYGVTDDGLPYIVMELLDGESLGDRLAREGRLVPRDVALVVSQTAQVLEEAHALGVVHRDIKPDNIFLIESGYELFVKVLDFGIAKQTTKLDVVSVTDTGAILGTPEYMAPEQLLTPKSADWRADMWALGVLAYRALIGVVPFSGETLPSLSIAICNAKFVLPSAVTEGLPIGVDAWFSRALEPDADERFESVLEMAHELTDLLRNATSEIVSVDPAAVVDVTVKSGSGTLASVKSERSPSVLPRPKIGILEAADDPSSGALGMADPDGPGFQDEARVESSRRRGAVVIKIERAASTSRPGVVERAVPSTMRFDQSSEKRYARLKIAGVLLSGSLVLAAADFVLRGPGEVPRPELAPSARAHGDELWTDNTAVLSPVRGHTELPRHDPRNEQPPVEPEPPASSAATISPTVAVATRPAPPRPTNTATPASSVAADRCKNPYITQKDGSLKIKPGCAR